MKTKKNSIFSFGIFMEGIRKLKIICLIAAALSVLITAAPSIVDMVDGPPSVPMACNYIMTCYMVPVIAIGLVPVLTMYLFSSFNKRAYCDFCHSLPYTRTCIFVSNVAAIMAWSLVLMLLSIIAGVTFRGVMPAHYAMDFTGYGFYILNSVLVALFLCFSATLATSITGTVFSNITLFALITVLPRFLITVIITTQVTENVPLIADRVGKVYLGLFSYEYNPIIGAVLNHFEIFGSPTTGWSGIVYSLVITIIYAALSIIFFKKRKSEITGQPAPGRLVQAIIRICLTLVPSALATILLMNDVPAAAIIFYLFSGIVFFAYEIISTHKWKNLVRALPSLGIVALLNVAIVIAITVITSVTLNYQPTPDKVDSMSIALQEYNENYSAVISKEVAIKDKEAIKIATDALSDNLERLKKFGKNNYNSYESFYIDNEYLYDYDNQYVTVDVYLKTGLVTRYRSVMMKRSDYQEIMSYLENNEDYKKAVMTLPKPVYGTLYTNCDDNISQKELAKILEVYQEEIHEKGYMTWITVLTTTNSFSINSENPHRFELYYQSSELNEEINIPIDSVYYPKTAQMFLEAVTESRIDDKQIYNAMEAIEGLEAGDEGYFALCATVVDNRGEETKYYSSRAEYRGERNYYGEDAEIYGENEPGDLEIYQSNFENASQIAALYKAAVNSKNKVGLYNFVKMEIIYDNYSGYADNGKYYYGEAENCYVSIYLPIPEDFDFEANGFKEKESFDAMYNESLID